MMTGFDQVIGSVWIAAYCESITRSEFEQVSFTSWNVGQNQGSSHLYSYPCLSAYFLRSLSFSHQFPAPHRRTISPLAASRDRLR